MASLHDALRCLQPTKWDSVPKSPEELREYVRDIFKSSRLVAESLPDPPPYENGVQNTPNASSSARVVPSSVRVGETDPEIIPLQKQWGKPIKMGGPKDNPLGVHVWKVSANDGGGSWFGRRSIHEGMSFTRWQEKLSSEYDETLKANRKKIEKGRTPDESIRGIGAEEKVETMEVKDEDDTVIAQITVYHVSAQFPKPTAPRDFVAMIITSDLGLRIGGTQQPGRSWLMISKPCDHPDVPPKQGYTRGNYESVELIREIPRKSLSMSSSSSAASTTGGNKTETSEKSETTDQQSQNQDEDLNPVEWIMVTRSDPGGSIPRWMVDKGTPRSVGADAAKFVDWAMQTDGPNEEPINSQDEDNQEADCPNSVPEESTKKPDCDGDDNNDEQESDDSDYDLSDSDTVSHHGLIASVTGLINSSIERYAPRSVYGYMPRNREPPRSVPGAFDMNEESTDEMEAQSTKSSTEKYNHDAQSSTEKEPERASLASGCSETATPIVDEVVQNNATPAELMELTKNGKLTSNEKDLAKLALRKREIEFKLDTIRAELGNLHITTQSAPLTPTKGVLNDADSDTSGMLKRAAENRSATPNSGSKQSSSSDGQNGSQSLTPTPELPSHRHKATSQLLNEESKLLKQLRKVEASQIKVASKIEARQRKDAQRSEKTKTRSEVESLRQEVKDLKKEVGKLRTERQKWVDLVASLQAENTKLVAKNSKEESSG
ncbi:uncharacterized protein N7483_010910 [Penicillium malachiteum]|uniref:uncharacterized protein n=1 Tax=Penicillium malachiteum TaxID=1324776 RepID=UPI002548BFE3|nr:uncharacterized protein N7483_010910 [Penicillium malachiteum]KAJ5713729.1 hypothetical protein N7483_010910 [Penicillium malachiteum]